MRTQPAFPRANKTGCSLVGLMNDFHYSLFVALSRKKQHQQNTSWKCRVCCCVMMKKAQTQDIDYSFASFIYFFFSCSLVMSHSTPPSSHHQPSQPHAPTHQSHISPLITRTRSEEQQRLENALIHDITDEKQNKNGNKNKNSMHRSHNIIYIYT